MAWIEKNGVRYYRIKKTIGHRTNKAGNIEPVCKEFFGRTKKDAEAKYQAYIEKEATGIDSKNQCFGIVADGWIQEFFIPDSTIKDSTKYTYLGAWNRYIKTSDIYHKPLDSISAKTIQGVYNKLHREGISSVAIKNINKLLRRFYKYLDFEGLSRDYSRSITIPTDETSIEENKIKIWEDVEVKKILSGFDKADSRFRLRFFVVLAYYTGCRISELLGVCYDDFTENGLKITKQLSDKKFRSYDNGKIETSIGIVPPKSKKSVRTIPLNPIVKQELLIHKAWHQKEMIKNGYRTDFVFTSNTGQFYEHKNIRNALSRYYKRIGVEYKSIHTYRHTFGTNLCKNGVPIQVASALLGHDDINTTARYYVDVNDEAKQEAIDKLQVKFNA